MSSLWWQQNRPDPPSRQGHPSSARLARAMEDPLRLTLSSLHDLCFFTRLSFCSRNLQPLWNNLAPPFFTGTHSKLTTGFWLTGGGQKLSTGPRHQFRYTGHKPWTLPCLSPAFCPARLWLPASWWPLQKVLGSCCDISTLLGQHSNRWGCVRTRGLTSQYGKANEEEKLLHKHDAFHFDSSTWVLSS